MKIVERFSVCGTPVFLVSLCVLLTNDLYLKTNYPSWLTGKLSDFAGLIVLPLLLFSLFPRQVRTLSWIVALFFVWWKGPYSQPFIDLINAAELFRIGRTIDYTDLLALVAIPFGARMFRSHRLQEPVTIASRRFVVLTGLLSACLAIAGTSVLPYTRAFVIQGESDALIVSDAMVQEVLSTIADSQDFQCRPPAIPTDRPAGACQLDNIWVTYEIDSGRVSFRVEDTPPFMSGGKRVRRRVDQLVERLRVEFRNAADGLEYVESLVDPREL